MRQARARAGRGFTLIELLVVVAIIALLISILMPSLARARELSKRTVCASNMKGIGVGFASYAAANNDAWPVPNHPKNANTATDTTVTYQRAIGAKRGSPDFPAAGETFDGQSYGGVTTPSDTVISTTRAFWMLVRAGNTPKSFVCPSASTDSPNPDENPQSYWDFGAGTTGVNSNTASVQEVPDPKVGWSQCSYGYQVPFGNSGTPSPNVDPDMALVADKGPFGASAEGKIGTGNQVTGRDANSSPEEWKPWNSPNHGGAGEGEGQNVMYNDGHAEFFTTPLVGVSKDNIYTQWEGAERIRGRGPTGTSPYTQLAPVTATDSLIYP